MPQAQVLPLLFTLNAPLRRIFPVITSLECQRQYLNEEPRGLDELALEARYAMLGAIQRADEQELQPRHFVGRNARPAIERAQGPGNVVWIEAIRSRRFAIARSGLLEQTLQAGRLHIVEGHMDCMECSPRAYGCRAPTTNGGAGPGLTRSAHAWTGFRGRPGQRGVSTKSFPTNKLVLELYGQIKLRSIDG